MKVKLTMTFECGETTCATEPGEFCRYLWVAHFGMTPFCGLYGGPLLEDNGWVKRCARCLNGEAP